MKFLFLTAALVHCASASSDSSGSGSPCPPNRTARNRYCGNDVAAKRTEEDYQLHLSRNPQKPAKAYKAPDAKFVNADPFARSLDEEEKDTELTLVACDKCQDCPTTPNKKDPSQLQYDVSKNCRKCYNPQTRLNNHYVEAPCRECNGTGQMPDRCTKCGKIVTDEEIDADQCSECDNHGEGWRNLQCDVCNGTGKHVCTIRKSLVYNMSVMVRTILEVDEGTTRIPCKEVDAETLNYICNYLEMVNGRTPKPITKPIRTKEIVQCVHEHDRADGEWIEGVYTDPEEESDGRRAVFNIMLAANSMDIQPLLHLGACKIATLIKGESPEEIKRILGNEDDVVNDAAAGLRRRRLQKLFGSF